MDSPKKRVGVLPSSSVVLIDVRKNVSLRRAPETLQEAENLRSLRVTVRAGLSKKSS
jgi:hypothetical protein